MTVFRKRAPRRRRQDLMVHRWDHQAESRERLDAVLARLTELAASGLLPRSPAWLWPDREDVVPVESVGDRWLPHYARDRSCYAR